MKTELFFLALNENLGPTNVEKPAPVRNSWRQKKYYSEQQIIKIVLFYFRFSYLYLFPGGAGKHKFHTPSQIANKEKYFNHKIYQGKLRLRREKNTFPPISSLIDLVLSIFRRQMNGSNPSEIDIKLLIPAPTQEIMVQNIRSKDIP